MEGKQLQASVRRCEMVSLEAGMEVNLTGLRCFCRAFRSTANVTERSGGSQRVTGEADGRTECRGRLLTLQHGQVLPRDGHLLTAHGRRRQHRQGGAHCEGGGGSQVWLKNVKR